MQQPNMCKKLQSLLIRWLVLGMCGIASVRFLKKTWIQFRMSLVRFGSKNAVWFGYYSYLLLM